MYYYYYYYLISILYRLFKLNISYMEQTTSPGYKVLRLQFMAQVMLYMFCHFTSEHPEVCVQCPIWLVFFAFP
jgi:hypothetical protein